MKRAKKMNRKSRKSPAERAQGSQLQCRWGADANVMTMAAAVVVVLVVVVLMTRSFYGSNTNSSQYR
jgi:hypothetical protein